MSTDLRIAQATGMLGYAAAAGGIASISIICIPNLTIPARRSPGSALLPARDAPGTSSSHLAHQWLDLYDRGKKIFPGLVVFGSAANAHALWVLRQSPISASSTFGSSWSTGTWYLIAIGTAWGIAPFTGLAMGKTNNRLKAHSQHDGAAGSEGTRDMVVSAQNEAKQTMGDEVPELLTHWAKLNLVRSVFPLLGAGIAFCAAVSS